VQALGELDADTFVIDGELAVPQHGAFSFDALLQRIHPDAQWSGRGLVLRKISLGPCFACRNFLILLSKVITKNQCGWARVHSVARTGP
jgi:hypothetical protein